LNILRKQEKMNKIIPSEVIRTVAEAVPKDCLENLVIIGSLATAFAYFGDSRTVPVRTKDIDCLLKPHSVAPEKGQAVATQLLKAGWQRRLLGDHIEPGNINTPENELPAIRLYHPEINPEDENAWFIELLTEPESSKDVGKSWTRIVLDQGHFGLPSFRYLSIAAFLPEKTEDFGLYYARPQMMALANMLEHPIIKPERMSTKFDGRDIKRSNKDLGRVLAIGYLEQEKGTIDFHKWANDWLIALKYCFPKDWENLAVNAGSGLIQLIGSSTDLEEAHHTCAYGLLSSFGVTQDELKEVGERIIGEAIDDLIERTKKH
jgi:hypothetical protein